MIVKISILSEQTECLSSSFPFDVEENECDVPLASESFSEECSGCIFDAPPTEDTTYCVQIDFDGIFFRDGSNFCIYSKSIELTFLILSISSLLRFCLCKSIDWSSLGFWCDSTKHSIIRKSRQIDKSTLGWNKKNNVINAGGWSSFIWTTWNLSHFLRLRYVIWLNELACKILEIVSLFVASSPSLLNKKSFQSMNMNWSSCCWNANRNERQIFILNHNYLIWNFSFFAFIFIRVHNLQIPSLNGIQNSEALNISVPYLIHLLGFIFLHAYLSLCSAHYTKFMCCFR